MYDLICAKGLMDNVKHLRQQFPHSHCQKFDKLVMCISTSLKVSGGPLLEQFNRITSERKEMSANDKGYEAMLYMLICGLNEETGELAGLLKREIRGDPKPAEAWISELGDVYWYLINLIDILNLDPLQILQYNQNKLEERYGNRSNNS